MSGGVNLKEFEFKYIVDQSTFCDLIDKIKTQYPNVIPKSKVQVNYYYDTDNYDLHKQGVTCRIRLSEKGMIGQYKEHYRDDSHCSQETEFAVNELPKTIMIHDTTLLFQGELVTQRISFLVTPFVKIECDTNYYWGNCDYEIEIEYEDGYFDDAKQIADSLMLKDNNNDNKYDRFMKSKKNFN